MALKVSIARTEAQGDVYTLLQPLVFRCGNGRTVSVPRGFTSDGASVPRFFWRWVFPPGDERALRAALLHDYLYRAHPEGWSKEDADRLFLAVLVLDGMAVRRALRAYAGVRFFGGAAWRAGGGKDTVQDATEEVTAG